MTVTSDERTTWVLSLDTVRQAIARLTEIRAHPFFLAYLHLRSRAASSGSDSNIRPSWNNELAPYIYMPGGPPKKPYYRPLFDPPGNPSRYWLNENLAGSFAPSSLREGKPPMQVVQRGTVDKTFSLRPSHAQRALEHLLFGERLPAYTFSSFLYRDFGFLTDGAEPEPVDLLEIFQGDWHFTGNPGYEQDLDTLFYEDDEVMSLISFEESPYSEEDLA